MSQEYKKKRNLEADPESTVFRKAKRTKDIDAVYCILSATYQNNDFPTEEREPLSPLSEQKQKELDKEIAEGYCPSDDEREYVKTFCLTVKFKNKEQWNKFEECCHLDRIRQEMENVVQKKEGSGWRLADHPELVRYASKDEKIYLDVSDL